MKINVAAISRWMVGVALSLVCVLAHAEAGRVEVLLGKATVERAGTPIAATQGMNIEAGDVIDTGAASSVQLRMASGEQIYLRSQSRFAVESFAAPKNRQDPGRSFYGLLRGGLRAITNSLVRRDLDSYRVNTAVATIGIRGTIYSLWLSDGLYVGVEEGEILFTNQGGSVVVKAGQYAYAPNMQTAPVLINALPASLAEEGGVVGGTAAGAAAAKAAAAGDIATPVAAIAGALGLVGVVASGIGGDDAAGTSGSEVTAPGTNAGSGGTGTGH